VSLHAPLAGEYSLQDVGISGWMLRYWNSSLSGEPPQASAVPSGSAVRE
jgi:hypothetical protein